MKDQAFDKGTHAEGRIPSFIHLFKIPHKEGALVCRQGHPAAMSDGSDKNRECPFHEEKGIPPTSLAKIKNFSNPIEATREAPSRYRMED